MNSILQIRIRQSLSSKPMFIVMGAIIGCFVVASWISVGQNEYRATVFHQVAAFDGKDIVSPASLTEHLKVNNFYSENTLKICEVNNGGAPSLLHSKPHKIIPSLLIISVDAISPKLASDCLEAKLTDIERYEDALLQTSIESVKRRSALYKQFSQSLGEASSVESATFTFLRNMRMAEDLNLISNTRPPQTLYEITVEKVSKLTQLNLLKVVLGGLLGGGLLAVAFLVRIRF